MPATGRSPLSYVFECHACQKPRLVKRTVALPEDTLSPHYHFYYKDLGLDCKVRDPTLRNAFPRTYYPEEGPEVNPRPWYRPSGAATRPPLSEPLAQSLTTNNASFEWGKQMKAWAGAITYDGSSSLVCVWG